MKRLVALVALVFALTTAAASSGGTLSNPGFETGDFSGGWAALNDGAGAWVINNGGPLLSGASMAPRHGAFSAAFDQNGPSLGILIQETTVPDDGVLTFSYAYVNDFIAWEVDTSGFPAEFTNEAQWFQIDVLDPNEVADPEDIFGRDSDAIIATVFTTDTDPPLSSGWDDVDVDLSAYIGQPVIFRVIAVDTESFLNVWIDGPGETLNVRGPHTGYCSVEGNTWPDGTAIKPGTFLELEANQPDVDAHFKGATSAHWIAGVGITCDNPPAGYTLQGRVDGAGNPHPDGVYDYWAPATTGADGPSSRVAARTMQNGLPDFLEGEFENQFGGLYSGSDWK